MIVDVFFTLWNGVIALVPPLPSPPSWWPTSGISIPLMGIASPGVVTAVLATYLSVLVLSSVIYAARRVVSLLTLGGGSL
ncbi:hypothetical protein [Nocardioides sp.]|uniref:hypothetical protein n=1 Tax=Nocardioides sp. TaxID=35761 RepID=UPI002638C2E5|nr:hypothetical protein [Nocardioides sp.]